MATKIVFETHSTSEDNELGVVSGWADSALSAVGRQQALRLGERRSHDTIAAVFSSDLRRAVETATIAFDSTSAPVFLDWRLRECDFGDHAGIAVAELRLGRQQHIDEPYPGGESWRQAVERVGRFVDDESLRRAEATVLVIGHTATRWALEHQLRGVPLEELVHEEFTWQEGWEYEIN